MEDDYPFPSGDIGSLQVIMMPNMWEKGGRSTHRGWSGHQPSSIGVYNGLYTHGILGFPY